MANTVTITQMQDVNGNPVAPLTPEEAIYDQNGERLSHKLSKLMSGLLYRGYIFGGVTLPSDDNSFYLTNDSGNYIDSEGNEVKVASEGVSIIQRKNGEWKVYEIWRLHDSLASDDSKAFLSARQGKVLKDMIDKLATQGGENRPTNINIGFQFFDTTLGKPIWWNGSKWVDSTGTEV